MKGARRLCRCLPLGRVKMTDWEKVWRLQSGERRPERQEDPTISVERLTLLTRPPRHSVLATNNSIGTDRRYGEGILGGIIAVILIGIAAFLWNSSSDGGLVHAFGGVTTQDLTKQITIPGPQGAAGPLVRREMPASGAEPHSR